MVFLEYVMSRLYELGFSLIAIFVMFLLTLYCLWSNRLKRFITLKELIVIINKDLRNEERTLRVPSTDIVLIGIITCYVLGFICGKS